MTDELSKVSGTQAYAMRLRANEVECPHCGAPVGMNCTRSYIPRTQTKPHVKRMKAAFLVLSGRASDGS